MTSVKTVLVRLRTNSISTSEHDPARQPLSSSRPSLQHTVLTKEMIGSMARSSSRSGSPAVVPPAVIAASLSNGDGGGHYSLSKSSSPVDKDKLITTYVDIYGRTMSINAQNMELNSRGEELKRRERELNQWKEELEKRLREITRQTNELNRKKQEVKRQENECERCKKARKISQLLEYAGGSSESTLSPSSSEAIAALIIRVDALEKQWRLFEAAAFNEFGRVDAQHALDEDIVHRPSA